MELHLHTKSDVWALLSNHTEKTQRDALFVSMLFSIINICFRSISLRRASAMLMHSPIPSITTSLLIWLPHCQHNSWQQLLYEAMKLVCSWAVVMPKVCVLAMTNTMQQSVCIIQTFYDFWFSNISSMANRDKKWWSCNAAAVVCATWQSAYILLQVWKLYNHSFASYIFSWPFNFCC